MNIKENAKKLSEFYAKVAETGICEVKRSSSPEGWIGTEAGPNLTNISLDIFRCELPKIVDMSKFIGSDFDMVFYNNSTIQPMIGNLLAIKIDRIDGVCEFSDEFGVYWPHCKPRLDHWNLFGGSEQCPIPDGVEAVLKMRSGSSHVYSHDTHGKKLRWIHNGGSGDVIAIKFTGLKEGWSYE